MTLPHSIATATITIDGLAVCCFNKADNKWDVGYLHHTAQPPHSLILQIDDEAPILIPDATALITFTPTNPQTPNYPGSPNGFFDPFGFRPDRASLPLSADQLEDFRWTINLEDPTDMHHGQATLKKPSFPITRTYIKAAVFYTSRVSPLDLYRAPFTSNFGDNPNNMDSTELIRHFFGRTNDEIAADIFCNPSNGAVTITIPGVLAQPRVLTHRPGNPWRVSLKNMCQPVGTGQQFERGDFQLFYDVLNVTGQRQALWGKPTLTTITDPDAARKGLLKTKTSGRTDCDTTWLGTSQTLDPLF